MPDAALGVLQIAGDLPNLPHVYCEPNGRGAQYYKIRYSLPATRDRTACRRCIPIGKMASEAAQMLQDQLHLVWREGAVKEPLAAIEMRAKNLRRSLAAEMSEARQLAKCCGLTIKGYALTRSDTPGRPPIQPIKNQRTHTEIALLDALHLRLENAMAILARMRVASLQGVKKLMTNHHRHWNSESEKPSSSVIRWGRSFAWQTSTSSKVMEIHDYVARELGIIAA